MQQEVSRTVAIDPTILGFSFAVLEGSERLVDWGGRRVYSNDDRELLARVELLLDETGAEVVVLEGLPGCRRKARARGQLEKLAALAVDRGLTVLRATRFDVQFAFSASGSTKREIAVAVGRWFPELAEHVPPPRKRWQPEPGIMNVFDAVAFALTALRDIGL